MSDFNAKYHRWLNEFSQVLQQAGQEQLKSMLELAGSLKAYLKAGKELSAYETQLFLETLKSQLQHTSANTEQPSMWTEELWEQLSQITDRTQVEWAELIDDFQHQGVYYQGEYVGMGRYRCRQCQHSIDYTHPAELLSCSHCGGVQFFRDGLPV